jgi:hypothetical protein
MWFSTQANVALDRTFSSAPTLADHVSERSLPLPHVLLLGGQDTPSCDRLVGCWTARCGAQLPSHQRSAVAWPPHVRTEIGTGSEQRMVQRGRSRPVKLPARLPRVLERPLARGVTGLVRYLCENLRLDPDGQPRGLSARLVHHLSRYSMDVMYNRHGLGDQLLARTVEALLAEPIDLIVAHSFGGTIALRAAWELWQRGERGRELALVTLGTASGSTVAQSPLLRPLPRSASGQIARLPNLRSWQHFWSANDVFVAAPMLPLAFEGVELREVDTGRLSPRAHALSAYLAAPDVVSSLRALMTAAERAAR